MENLIGVDFINKKILSEENYLKYCENLHKINPITQFYGLVFNYYSSILFINPIFLSFMLTNSYFTNKTKKLESANDDFFSKKRNLELIISK